MKHDEEEPIKQDEGQGESHSKDKADKAKKTLKAFLFLIIKLAAVAVIIWLALEYVFGVFRLSGNNMYPALKDGDLCVTYKLEEYNGGDVVAYFADDRIRFGRIVAKAGDTVNGDEQGILINGSHPSEEIFYPTQILDTNLPLPYTLGSGEFVILNDYRSDLEDSRTYSVITEDELEGKIIFIFRRRGF